MSLHNVRLSTDLLVRSEETQKDYSLYDMVKVLKPSPHVKDITHTESDRGPVRDIKSRIDFGSIVLSFHIMATEKFFTMRGVELIKDGSLIRGGWSSKYESFVLETDEVVKKTIHDFLLAVTKIL